jgi:hypothetical protein
MTPVPCHPDDPTPGQPDDCSAFATVIQQVLDRELGPDALDADHTAGCQNCRTLALAARSLLDASLARPEPPVGLTDRIIAAALRDRRVRRRRRFTGAALAASLLVAVSAYLLWPVPSDNIGFVHAPPAPPPPEPDAPEAPPPRVADRVADAGSVVVAMSRKARDQTVNPTRTLIPPPELVSIPSADLLPGIEPAAGSLAGMPDAARSGLEPVADKTRRAVNLFLRDVGFTPSAKPNS